MRGDHIHEDIEAVLGEFGSTGFFDRRQWRHVHLYECHSDRGVGTLNLGDQRTRGFSISATEVDVGRLMFGKSQHRSLPQSRSAWGLSAILSAGFVGLGKQPPVIKMTFSSRDGMSLSGLNSTNSSRLGMLWACFGNVQEGEIIGL